jgi:FkbM family methyltransferase
LLDRDACSIATLARSRRLLDRDACSIATLARSRRLLDRDGRRKLARMKPPRDSATLLHLATEAIDAGEDQRASQTLGELLQLDPDHAEGLWQAGRYFALKEAYGEGAEHFRRAVDRDPRLSHVSFRVGPHRITLRDVPGSRMPALVLEEFGRGMYGLRERRLAAGDVVIDIGAHIGAVSIILAKLNPRARVVAYEPAASNYAMFLENLAANHVGNVVAVREAVAGARGTLELMWSPTETAGASALLPEGARRALEGEGWERQPVSCVTLDDVFARHAIDRCAFLKLDCEGAEWGIARHADSLGRVESLALELHLPTSRQGEGIAALQQEFGALLTNRARFPAAVISSTVWMQDQ